MKTQTHGSTLPLHLPPQECGIQNWESLAHQCSYRVSRLAKLCQVSVRTLQRHFRKYYDLTLSEWLRELRLEQSRSMLKDAPCVKMVAFDLGYKQPSHFTRDFKLRYGIPPKTWQLAVQGRRTMRPIVETQIVPSEMLPAPMELFASC